MIAHKDFMKIPHLSNVKLVGYSVIHVLGQALIVLSVNQVESRHRHVTAPVTNSRIHLLISVWHVI